MSKNVKIIVGVACLVLAALILSWNFDLFSGGGSVVGDGKTWIKCVNPDCNQSYSLTSDEFAKLRGDNPVMMPMMGPSAYKCQKCGQQSAYLARQCKKCNEIFIVQMQMPIPGQENQDFGDRCPKCGYSETEELSKEQK